MNDSNVARYRQQLADLQADLTRQNELGQDGQKTVELDQQSVGRLSRMDAIQQQAMANATQARRNTLHLRIRAALDRIDEGEFGYCLQCGEQIPAARLDADATIPICVSCARN